MFALFSLSTLNVWLYVQLLLVFLAGFLWVCWVVPEMVKFSLWVLLNLIFMLPFLLLGYLGLVLALGNPIAFFIILVFFFPVKRVFYFILVSISFSLYLFRIWLGKIYRYTSRYFAFSSSINIMFDDLDLYWVEILRDWLYPNDDRYRLIYRRWVFWVNNEKYQERYDYYITFFWGYLARQCVMAVYLGWFYGLRFLNRILMKYLGTTLGSTLVFFSLCTLFLLFRAVPAKIAQILWLSYRFMCRQLYYLTGGFVIFELAMLFNLNWMEWDVSSNVDEFEDPDYSLARSPSSRMIGFFHVLNAQASLYRRSGLNNLNILVPSSISFKKFLVQLFALMLFYFSNLTYFGLSFLSQFIAGFFYLQSHLLKLSRLKLVTIGSLKEFVRLFLESLGRYSYNIFIVFFNFSSAFLQDKIYPYLIFVPAMLFYMLVQFWRAFFFLPLGLLFGIKLVFSAIFKLRGLALIIFLFLIFSKEYLSFFYFFSLGWFSDLVLSTLDNFTLIQQQFYIMPFSTRLLRGRRHVETHVYGLFWMHEFLDALFSYQYYLLKNLQQLLRLRNFWKQVTYGWRPWLFFIRFMPFFGQTTLIKKIWFERIYLWLRTPALFWWCYSGFDRLFYLSWVLSTIVHGLIFLPHGVFQSWFYYVFWLMPHIYMGGAYVYTGLWYILVTIKNILSYSTMVFVIIKLVIGEFVGLAVVFTKLIIESLFMTIWFVVKYFCAVFFYFSWISELYTYFCVYEIVSYWGYSFYCYWWLLGLMFSDFKHWMAVWENLFSSWMHFYFIYGFFFTYLNYSWNSLYNWWIASPLKQLYSWFPSLYSLVSMVDYVAINGNPLVYHVAIFLRVQKLLDSLCISLQLPRDVQRNAYVFIIRRRINVKFLGWLIALRRTPMYSLDRWLMPVFSYFKVLEAIHLTGQITFNFSGLMNMEMLRLRFPSVYYGFIWNSYGVYFFALAVILVLSKEFTRLLFHPFPEKTDQNREYAWKRFREEHPRNLKWMFFDLKVALQLEEHTKIHNDLTAKFFYYEQLLKNITNASHGGSLKKAMVKFFNSSFWVRRSSLLSSEEDVFISPLFFDFYLQPRYVDFRVTMHKGDDLFTFFSAYAFSLNPWIQVAWDSTDQEDYQQVIEEVTFHASSRRQFIIFHEKVRALQHAIDKIIFSSRLYGWTLLKEPLNMSIIRISFHDDLNSTSVNPSYYHTLSPDLYEFEDDEDMTYVSWPMLAWFCAIPFMLFYKSFFFLGGFNWHYNRASPAIIQSFMLYFNSVVGHIQFINYARRLIGDNYLLHKREGSIKSHSHMYYYRSYIRGVIKRSFYSYKLPYRGLNSWMSLDKIWNLKTVSFKFQFLTSSLLEELRFVNLGLFLWIVVIVILVRRDVVGPTKNMPPLGYPINFPRLVNNYSIKSTLKRLYIWFWQ